MAKTLGTHQIPMNFIDFGEQRVKHLLIYAFYMEPTAVC
ncbi:Uncharacterised protein [Vibrio cholerae]|nr:hypothetical protein VIG_002809 [Vibrio cholerae INDRE 91/1]CSH97424.1 Uncharacterised protein [Vibrio cholerae]